LPRTTEEGHSDPGILWQAGPSVRFQADRKSTDWVFSHINPWLDISPTIAATGNLVRPAVNVGIGAEGPLDKYRIFWFGPFARFTHVFAAESEHHDANVLQVGFSFSFDSPIKLPTVVVREQAPVAKPVVIHDVKVVKEVVHEAAPLDFSEKVYFDANSSVLRWESKDKLDAVAAKLNREPGLKIKVSGNASSEGLLTVNNKLSQTRTKSVLDYLVKHGVDPKRLVAESDGIARPAASNKNKEGRERNRRVEFNVLFSVSK
jgi:outer membrane protein OmpA-like peptidoglycan-associated protein